MSTGVAPVSTKNPIQQAVAAVAPELAAMFDQYIEANKPAIEARITAAGDSAVSYVETAIISALPTKGVLATVLAPEAKAVITSFAQSIVAKFPTELDALVALAEMEITNFATQLAS